MEGNTLPLASTTPNPRPTRLPQPAATSTLVGELAPTLVDIGDTNFMDVLSDLSTPPTAELLSGKVASQMGEALQAPKLLVVSAPDMLPTLVGTPTVSAPVISAPELNTSAVAENSPQSALPTIKTVAPKLSTTPQVTQATTDDAPAPVRSTEVQRPDLIAKPTVSSQNLAERIPSASIQTTDVGTPTNLQTVSTTASPAATVTTPSFTPLTGASTVPGPTNVGIELTASKAAETVATRTVPAPHQQLATAMVSTNDRTIEVRLDPPHLGRVVIEFDTPTDAQMRAVVTADNDSTLALLRKNSLALLKELSDQGFSDTQLEFQQRQDGTKSDETPSAPITVTYAEVDPSAPVVDPAPYTVAIDDRIDIKL